MKEAKKIFNILTIGQIILDIIIIALSIFYASYPETSTQVLGRVFGLLLVVLGAYDIIKYLLNYKKKSFILVEILSGLFTIIAGIFILINPFSLASILTIGLGIWLIISATFKLVIAIEFKKFKEETWLLNLIISILTLIIGIIVILNPFKTYITIASLVGILISCYCAIDIVQQLLFRKRIKEVVDIFLH